MASSVSSSRQLILYHYSYSPYARRVAWYLTLRGIPYSQCVGHIAHIRQDRPSPFRATLTILKIQPPVMPRPDLKALGISYRRIPLLAIDRDVYLDTRLMIQKLEKLFPETPPLGAPSTANDSQALERLLASMTTDSGLFEAAVNLLPTDLPLLRSEAYWRDRAQFLKGNEKQENYKEVLSPETMQAARSESEDRVAHAMDFLENGLLSDGRRWILGPAGSGGSDSPTLADIEAIWPFHWLIGLPGALPAHRFGKDVYPRLHAWVERFQEALSAAKTRIGKPATLSGEEARNKIASASHEDLKDMMMEGPGESYNGVKIGDQVQMWPTDTGSSHKDRGTLVALDSQKFVIEVVGDAGPVRLHAPRHGFRIARASDSGEKVGMQGKL